MAAVEGLKMEKACDMAGIFGQNVVYTPLTELTKIEKLINLDAFRINEILSI